MKKFIAITLSVAALTVGTLTVSALISKEFAKEVKDVFHFFKTEGETEKRMLERLEREPAVSPKTAPIIAAPGQEQVEKQIQDWLNGQEDIRQVGLRCVSINLKRDSRDEYSGLATFDNGEQVHIEVVRKADSDKLYFKADLPAMVLVQSGVLPDYDYTTIGKAFNSFFTDPNWITRISENGAKFVEFKGRLKEDFSVLQKDDKIYIRFAFSHDGKTFNLWSVQIEGGEPIRANDWQKPVILDKLLEAIYELK